MSFTEDLLSILGKRVRAKEVVDVIQGYGLGEVYDDPPFRRYIGSSEKGVDLLCENDEVIDIQFYVQKSKTHSAFLGDLPLGIQRGMSDTQIHALLGTPETYGEVGSRYTVLEGTAKLTVIYDKSKIVGYLSIKKI